MSGDWGSDAAERSDGPVWWRCTKCGARGVGRELPRRCTGCGDWAYITRMGDGPVDLLPMNRSSEKSG